MKISTEKFEVLFRPRQDIKLSHCHSYISYIKRLYHLVKKKQQEKSHGEDTSTFFVYGKKTKNFIIILQSKRQKSVSSEIE